MTELQSTPHGAAAFDAAGSPKHAQMSGVVTGAASGIGRACTELLRARGHVVIGWDSNAVGDVDESVDIVSSRDLRRATESIAQNHDSLNFLVNCAGRMSTGQLGEIDADDARSLFDVNVVGTTLVTQSLLPLLRAGAGSIVNVASTVALRPSATNSMYAASKAAIAHLTRCWALELAPDVRVNAVAPGPIPTGLHRRGGMTAQEETDLLAQRAATIPLRRAGTVEDAARWIVRFLDPQDWVTGVVLAVDGGMSLGTV